MKNLNGSKLQEREVKEKDEEIQKLLGERVDLRDDIEMFQELGDKHKSEIARLEKELHDLQAKTDGILSV